MTDPKHPEHDEMVEWYGRHDFDPEYFNLDRINDALRAWAEHAPPGLALSALLDGALTARSHFGARPVRSSMLDGVKTARRIEAPQNSQLSGTSKP